MVRVERKLRDNFYWQTGLVDDLLKLEYTDGAIEGYSYDEIEWPESNTLSILEAARDELETKLQEVNETYETLCEEYDDLKNEQEEAPLTEAQLQRLAQLTVAIPAAEKAAQDAERAYDDADDEVNNFDDIEDRGDIFEWILWTGGSNEWEKSILLGVGVPVIDTGLDLYIGRQCTGQSVELDHWYYQAVCKHGYLSDEAAELEALYWKNYKDGVRIPAEEV
jgi:hypothetical protein